MNQTFDKGTVMRSLVAIALAIAALSLFFLNRKTVVIPPEPARQDLSEAIKQIDREVESLLAKFRIEEGWIRKRRVSTPDKTFFRVERRIKIPQDIIPALVNVELNSMAHRFDGRAVATENLKENSVTIHIELGRTIVQTIVLILQPDLKRKEKTYQVKKV